MSIVVYFSGCGQRIWLQLLQLELRLGRIPSRSFRPIKSAETFWQIWTSCSLWFIALDRLGAGGRPSLKVVLG
ncbi:hypothetical protein Tco_1337816 [Tanacetum coccineum]